MDAPRFSRPPYIQMCFPEPSDMRKDRLPAWRAPQDHSADSDGRS